MEIQIFGPLGTWPKWSSVLYWRLSDFRTINDFALASITNFNADPSILIDNSPVLHSIWQQQSCKGRRHTTCVSVWNLSLQFCYSVSSVASLIRRSVGLALCSLSLIQCSALLVAFVHVHNYSLHHQKCNIWLLLQPVLFVFPPHVLLMRLNLVLHLRLVLDHKGSSTTWWERVETCSLVQAP